MNDDVIKNAGNNNLDLAEWSEKIMLGRCKACEFCRDAISKSGLKYKGCFCEPHKGKWICTIKECPKEG